MSKKRLKKTSIPTQSYEHRSNQRSKGQLIDLGLLKNQHTHFALFLASFFEL